MGRIVAGINVTLDGIFDHTVVVAGAELHRHYTDLLSDAAAILYGRTTYHLMEYWKAVKEAPTGEQSTDEFARVMDALPKIVFSNTLTTLDWQSARLAGQSLEAEVSALRQQPGKDILVGSRSLMIQLLELDLIDELQLCIHPVIAGNGQLLWTNGMERKMLKLMKTKTMDSGAVVLYYEQLGQ